MKFGIDVLTALTQIWTTNMAVTFALGLRAFCVATGLLLATARGAEPVSPLIGATRDQLLSRYGEPKSQIAAGNRVIYFYTRERVVLRDNVVVEVEPLGGDARRVPEPAETTPATGATSGATSPTNSPNDAASRPAPSTTPAPAPRPPQPAALAPPPAGDSKVEIKLVRPPSSVDSRPAVPETTSPTIVAAPPPVAPKTAPVETPAPAPVQPAPSAAKKASVEAKSTAATETKQAVEPPKKPKEEAKKAPVPKAESSPAEEPDSGFGTQIYVIGLAVFVGGVALLFWRHRQRQLVLAATSVSNTPLPSTTSTSPFVSNAFTLDELNKLDAKKFEELVAAYYSKTGVVAERTKAGPESPVHIKIAWKGEPRPFAYVQCLAQPGATIDPKPLQALVAVLEKDNIRRGYIVTSGKFNAIARDFAEQKHLTLLPSDTFLEKLNALPSAARIEIIQSISNGSKA